MRMHIELDLPADACLLPKTRWALSGYMQELGADTDAIGDAILALDEACANVVRHAFPDGRDATFRVVAEITDDAVDMSVEDEGVGFNPDEVDLRDGNGTGGRGLHMIRQLMTSVDVRSPTERGVGTRLHMQKRLRETV